MKILSNKHKIGAFTLVEMVIVLIIMGILLMMTMALSGNQIQKIKNKTVKESILAEWQSHYSRNLGSSSFDGIIYDTMTVNLSEGSNGFNFVYTPRNDDEQKDIKFSDKFEIKHIVTNYDENVYHSEGITNMDIQYHPYKMYCDILGDGVDDIFNIVLVVRVNDNQDYCFEIQRQNCRLMEMSESTCNIIKDIGNWNI